MSSNFDSLCADALVPHLQQWFAETITYAGNTVSAQVRRLELDETGPHGARIEYVIEIRIAQADVATVNIGSDPVLLKKRLGDSSDTTMEVSKLISQDGGMWRLRLQ